MELAGVTTVVQDAVRRASPAPCTFVTPACARWSSPTTPAALVPDGVPHKWDVEHRPSSTATT
jgi:hypothetical protein